MSTTFTRYVEEDARLIILRELHVQSDGRLNDRILCHVLESFGHNRSREWVRTQLHKMAELGAVETREAGSVIVAQITRLGVDHVLRRAKVEGIKQPSLGV